MPPKKVVIKKEPEKKPSTVIAKSTHEKVVAEKDALIKEKKSEITSAKAAANSWEEKAKDWEAKYNSVKDKVDNTIEDTRGYINRGNKWVFAVPGVLLAIIVYVVLTIHNGDVRKQRDGLLVENADLKNKLSLKGQGSNYDSTHVVNNSIPTPDTEGEKKNSSRNNSK